MGFYEECCTVDIIEPILQQLQSRLFKFRKDGTIDTTEGFPVDGPWHFQKLSQERNCKKWLGVYFKRYGLIPKSCYGCWKVVVKPLTLKQLFEIKDIQAKMDLPSKCGIERRPYAPSKGYAAFWYTPLGKGVESGRDLCTKVNRNVNHMNLRPILKRGCTEMENFKGPSDLWEYTDNDERLEALLNATFTAPIDLGLPPASNVIRTLRLWIEHAWLRKDPTVWDFAEKSSFPPPPVEYQDSKHETGKGGLV